VLGNTTPGTGCLEVLGELEMLSELIEREVTASIVGSTEFCATGTDPANDAKSTKKRKTVGQHKLNINENGDTNILLQLTTCRRPNIAHLKPTSAHVTPTYVRKLKIV
jgi:hypothetical protein